MAVIRLGSIERIEAVADLVVKTKQQGHQVVVVLSAMSGETNRLINLAAKITRQFEGNKWQLPAQVYARSMTFFPGQFLSEQEVL